MIHAHRRHDIELMLPARPPLPVSRDGGLENLLRLADTLAGTPPGSAGQLADAMQLSAAQAPWQSTLNNDGTPLQVCVSMGTAGCSIRLLVDPAAEGSSDAARIAQVDHALSALLASHAPSLAAPCRQVLDQLLPADPEQRAALPSGGAWLAGGLGQPGMALYVTTKWGDAPQRWPRACQWLAGWGVDTQATLDALIRHTTPVSAGIEGISTQHARAKLYWRMNGTAPLLALGLPRLSQPELHAFLQRIIANHRIPYTAVVGSVSFHLADGSLSDVKLDVCGHCVPRPWAEWLPILRACVTHFGLDGSALAVPALTQDSELAFIGFGLDHHLSPRLNLYLKRPLA